MAVLLLRVPNMRVDFFSIFLASPILVIVGAALVCLLCMPIDLRDDGAKGGFPESKTSRSPTLSLSSSYPSV